MLFALVLVLVQSWAQQGQVVMDSLSAKSLPEVAFPLVPVLVSEPAPWSAAAAAVEVEVAVSASPVGVVRL